MQDTLKTLQAENAVLRRELEVLRESFDRFSGLAAHDLQGPLRKIVQSGEILHMDTKDILSEENLYFLDAMNSAAQRLRQLIFDLIKYTDLSRQALKRVSVDLNPVVKTCIEEGRVLGGEEMRFNQKPAKAYELPIVWADAEEINTLFKALLDNSFKFRKHEQPLKIDVQTREAQNHIHIDIIDNGIGIAQLTSIDIFEPFIRLNEKSAYEGSGLGLSVCRLICQRHGWSLDYQKDCTEGAVMTISLPKTDCGPSL